MQPKNLVRPVEKVSIGATLADGSGTLTAGKFAFTKGWSRPRLDARTVQGFYLGRPRVAARGGLFLAPPRAGLRISHDSFLAFPRAGIRMPMSSAMMAITTSNSISVNARRLSTRDCHDYSYKGLDVGENPQAAVRGSAVSGSHHYTRSSIFWVNFGTNLGSALVMNNQTYTGQQGSVERDPSSCLPKDSDHGAGIPILREASVNVVLEDEVRVRHVGNPVLRLGATAAADERKRSWKSAE